MQLATKPSRIYLSFPPYLFFLCFLLLSFFPLISSSLSRSLSLSLSLSLSFLRQWRSCPLMCVSVKLHLALPSFVKARPGMARAAASCQQAKNHLLCSRAKRLCLHVKIWQGLALPTLCESHCVHPSFQHWWRQEVKQLMHGELFYTLRACKALP